ncbi:MAG TPA: Asp-tRNA(Asn)/Glu-tRNA(Gln) amidotransferase subunit GatB [Solirubrobacterales bacterium]|jgi:aspartyl-tRNA(Asn)/glutamyl-tRNA(Gln) amidotransferase subunit B|nr:Asp-tRNA(Asn)/Glu-tRNA(Gln) amidotransferase subunit GatB [Solirubrobacterales bacterium]
MAAPAELEAVIGLEIHVQLATRTKMFCGCELSFGEEPNVHTCPICLAHPGVLPVPNEQAIRYALQIAAALECEVAPRSIFHRKNYFYPDNPKAYQISQYDIPLASNGRLGEVRIHRAHLEEDAAKMIHVGESGRIHGSGASLVDFNRGGTPLVEIVTEPDLRGAAQAAEWARLLRETVRQLGVSDVNMEEGSLRVDANVSVRPAGSERLGTKTELKNMNSFRFLQRGIEAELARQRELIAAGGTVEQETLHFDPQSGSLTSLRSKEEAHDYRYFPEPDLVPLAPTEAMLREAREALPELPAARIGRYVAELGLAKDVAMVLATDPETASYFERVAAEADGVEPKVVANWVTGELAAALRAADSEGGAAGSKVDPEALAELVRMVGEKQISHASGKTVLGFLVAEGGEPAAIVEREGLAQMSDSGELEAIVAAAVEANPEAAERVRAGNEKAIGAIVGAVMRETKGRADGGEVNRLIRERLGV